MERSERLATRQSTTDRVNAAEASSTVMSTNWQHQDCLDAGVPEELGEPSGDRTRDPLIKSSNQAETLDTQEDTTQHDERDPD